MSESLILPDSERLQKRLHHIQSVFKRSLKRAKVFLIQKHLKIIKKQSKDQSTETTSTLVSELKKIDLESLSAKALDEFIPSLEEPLLSLLIALHPLKSVQYSQSESLLITSSIFHKAIQECKTSLKTLLEMSKVIHERKERLYKKVYAKKTGKDASTKKKKKQPKRKRETDEDSMHSKFVSSLGGDELSDVEGVDEKKKNRPGQRARREKWERKYGKEANHIKAEAEAPLREQKELESLHPSWAAKKRQRLIISTDNAQGKKILFDEPSRPQPAHNPLASDPKTGFNHPSWDAKRKEKEAHAKIMASAKPKKIVFDD